jgi:iron complex transport system substrate-binding protein
MPRIVSLIASATEIVCALGFERDLMGRSHECDYPPSVHGLPVCTAPKFDTSGSSADIDRRVKDALRDATSVYHVDAELLRTLRPDVIVTQAQCEVCAVSLKDVERAVCSWVDAPVRVVSLQPNALADVWTDIDRVAQALDAPERGQTLVRGLQRRMYVIAETASKLDRRPRVACLEWIDPLMAAGNWMPELVELAGGANLFGQAGKHAPWLTWEQMAARDPDVIIALPCGFDLPRTRAEMATLAARPEWPRLSAVRNGQVYVTDGNQFFNRPGPRLVESLEILAEILHPEAFRFGHQHTGWQPCQVV